MRPERLPDGSTYSAKLRERRQITLSRALCAELGVRTGDSFDMKAEDGVLVLVPRRGMGLDALREVQRAFAAAGVGEAVLRQAAHHIRQGRDKAEDGSHA